MASEKNPSSLPGSIQNELSRTLSTESIFHTAGGKRRQSRRVYEMHVEASEKECRELAQRFDLPAISSLSASVKIQRPSQEMGGSTSYANGLSACQIDGGIEATVTQVCVRTSEQFTSHVNITLKALVIPISSAQSIQNSDEHDENLNYDDERLFRDLQKNTNRHILDTKSLRNTQDILELSKLVDEVAEESGEHVIVEDESIYSAQRGELDVGELVAQTFWLGLDPYPKKPGTDPVQFSISG
jgi:hypothetical protein